MNTPEATHEPVTPPSVKRVRYVIKHHPMLMTQLCVEEEGGTVKVIEDRMTWGVLREYCRESLKQRGIEPVIVKPEPYVEVFPWVTL